MVGSNREARTQWGLICREERIRDPGGVLMHIHDETRHVIQGDTILHPVHHRLDQHAVAHCAIMANVNPEILNLDDALVLWEVNIGLDVYIIAHMIIEDLDLRQTRWDLPLHRALSTLPCLRTAPWLISTLLNHLEFGAP